jgi:hypothetical protein
MSSTITLELESYLISLVTAYSNTPIDIAATIAAGPTCQSSERINVQ